MDNETRFIDYEITAEFYEKIREARDVLRRTDPSAGFDDVLDRVYAISPPLAGFTRQVTSIP